MPILPPITLKFRALVQRAHGDAEAIRRKRLEADGALPGQPGRGRAGRALPRRVRVHVPLTYGCEVYAEGVFHGRTDLAPQLQEWYAGKLRKPELRKLRSAFNAGLVSDVGGRILGSGAVICPPLRWTAGVPNWPAETVMAFLRAHHVPHEGARTPRHLWRLLAANGGHEGADAAPLAKNVFIRRGTLRGESQLFQGLVKNADGTYTAVYTS